jgi:murein DD-endopeptidase MepM/ murein hydrolase activator NlpD
MNKTYSILIFPWRGRELRRLIVSKRSLCCLLACAMILVGAGGWLLGDYLRIKLQKDGIKEFKVEVQAQRRRLFLLQEKAESIQALLADWKGLQKKIDASLPVKYKTHANGNSTMGGDAMDELEITLASLRKELEHLIASVPSRWPTPGHVSSGVGMRASPWTGKSEFHAGLDIPNPTGTPVLAPADGTVETAEVGEETGKTIVLNHGRGITTRYAHLSKILVRKGDQIRTGQQIAKVGNTGKSTNPHLHYEVRVHGVPIDPRRNLLAKNHPSS